MEPTPTASASVRLWESLALATSVAALAGSLYLSMGMQLKACPLCLYERTFMMSLVGVLVIGLARPRDAKPGFSVLLCVPLAIGGLGVAAFHVYLELTGVLECPAGIFGLGTAPQQSLAAFVVVSILMGIALVRSSTGNHWLITCLGAVVLGGLFSIVSIKSAPPLPKPPTEPYKTPLEGCRPIFVGENQSEVGAL